MGATPLARLASHSIHITTTPPPRTLSDSKRVLSALQKFGEVVTFRNLKYDVTNTSRNPNRAIIAIYESADSARRALAASPLRIPLVSLPLTPFPSYQHATGQNQTSQVVSAVGDASNYGHASVGEQGAKAQRDGDGDGDEEVMVCEIRPSRHNHHSAMQRNPFHGPFQVDRENYLFDDVVRSRVPVKALAEGCMLRKERVSGQVKRRVQRENERLGGRSLQKLFAEGQENLKTKAKGENVQEG